ncbi:cyclin-dependent kinases regulatory subunit 1 isoform X1 [Rhineura floridana]|uniref:cyclin-dependent kinases regulatory subunit 1 isoform X1 n=1 Tax=Rhineura floridana TaxID=261503 RepID=UPI002AC8628C|nr:cyclin-dependent kinases regulatory subunit 1 isoform X1 [Rhineura floridana]XP_061462724.1 cyclin-dependent kinases regulatory subunit 1 isoform X1 [Rhineura floridana]
MRPLLHLATDCFYRLAAALLSLTGIFAQPPSWRCLGLTLGSSACKAGALPLKIYYSDKYDDEEFEYRHVMLPKDIAKLVPKTHLMSESEWRNLGVQQSQGWVHYMIHEPEPHILLFRRPLPKKPEK